MLLQMAIFHARKNYFNRQYPIKMVGQKDMELASSHKYMKNASTNGTILTAHLLNTSRRPQTPERTGMISK